MIESLAYVTDLELWAPSIAISSMAPTALALGLRAERKRKAARQAHYAKIKAENGWLSEDEQEELDGLLAMSDSDKALLWGQPEARGYDVDARIYELRHKAAGSHYNERAGLEAAEAIRIAKRDGKPLPGSLEALGHENRSDTSIGGMVETLRTSAIKQELKDTRRSVVDMVKGKQAERDATAGYFADYEAARATNRVEQIQTALEHRIGQYFEPQQATLTRLSNDEIAERLIGGDEYTKKPDGYVKVADDPRYHQVGPNTWELIPLPGELLEPDYDIVSGITEIERDKLKRHQAIKKYHNAIIDAQLIIPNTDMEEVRRQQKLIQYYREAIKHLREQLT